MSKKELIPKVPAVFKIVSLTLITTFSVVFFSYHLAYAKKIIPGVTVWQIELGNKTRTQAEATLAAKFLEKQSQKIIFRSEKKDFEFGAAELGLGYDTEQTIRQALAVGRSGNLIRDLTTEVSAWFRGTDLKPTLKVDQQKLNAALTIISQELDDPAADALFAIGDGDLKITQEKSGRVVIKDQLQEKIRELMTDAATDAIHIPISHVEPETTAADLESVKPQVEKIISLPLALTYRQRRFQPTATEILSFIKIKKSNGDIKIQTDPAPIAEYIAGLAKQIDREPTGDIFRLDGARVVEFRIASEGLILDQEQSLTLFSTALLNGEETVELPVNVSPPRRSANDYGIKELLGEGVSNFTGSAPGRIHNIVTASNRLKGMLIAPGETFSFNSSLGEVSAATGYDQAYIISEGRTILGTGGGVCQVSTTVFRAAFNSGLEILKRTAHAYRVSYYEPPVGFDATVYAPSPDLLFKNDTSDYILIWSEADLSRQNLYFRIYGTADGRTTKTIGPFIANETPPPLPKYEEDPSLPKGTTKQIDWAAWGADTTLKREVYRDGKVLHADTFYSHFQPWRAIFLVGTGG